MIYVDTDRVKLRLTGKAASHVRIYAHKGFSAQYPENTLASFRAALDQGMYGIELDIHCSADGVPVVIHDETLEGRTSGAGPVSDRTAAELARLDAGSGEHVPALEEVLELVERQAHFDLEIKARACETSVLAVLDRHPEVTPAISSFDWELLANVRALSPGMELWVLTHQVTNQAVTAARQVGASTLAVLHSAIDRNAMDRANEAGLNVMAWTVNEQAVADRLRELGVAALCTDDPESIH